MNRNFNNFSRDNRDSNHLKKRSRSLRLLNIMIFDFVKHTATFFIKRYSYIADIKKEKTVLKILLMCLIKN